MFPDTKVTEQAIAAQIAQRLAAPAEAILGYQELIVEDMQALGIPDILKDAEQVLMLHAHYRIWSPNW